MAFATESSPPKLRIRQEDDVDVGKTTRFEGFPSGNLDSVPRIPNDSVHEDTRCWYLDGEGFARPREAAVQTLDSLSNFRGVPTTNVSPTNLGFALPTLLFSESFSPSDEYEGLLLD